MNKQELLEVLKTYGFSKKVLLAFKKVRREDFISKDLQKYAYINEPLPIGKGATISQPYTIAFMLELLELENLVINMNNEQKKSSKMKNSEDYKKLKDINKIKILEIGSGSGYVIALINEICNCKIYGIEIIKELVDKSKKILNGKNIKIICGNGFFGLKKYSRFDRILISAASDEIPSHLYDQLSDEGILVCPVKNSIFQITKKNDKDYKIKEFPGFVFVPLQE